MHTHIYTHRHSKLNAGQNKNTHALPCICMKSFSSDLRDACYLKKKKEDTYFSHEIIVSCCLPSGTCLALG